MHFYFVDLLRCVATTLITNSHYNEIWPVAAMATGGALGNTLFFAISGFCLSSEKNYSFFGWFKKRLLRIYPAVWIVTLIEFVFHNPSIHSAGDIITFFIYPTQFWFISAIVLFYVVFFIITKYCDDHLNTVIAAIALVYFGVYFLGLDRSAWIIEGSGYFKWIFYFEVMLIAYSYKKASLKSSSNRSIPGLSIVLSLTVLLYFSFKLLINKFAFLMNFQFIIHIISIVFMLECFEWGKAIEEQLKCESNSAWFKCVVWVGKMSLEIYLVQTFVIRLFKTIVFPGNLFVTTLMILLLAFLLHCITGFISKCLKGGVSSDVKS